MKRKKLLAALTAFTMAAATAVNGLYISAAAAGIPAAEDSQDLIYDCGGRAGYDYLGTMENGDVMQELYDEMYDAAYELWCDTDTQLDHIQKYGMIGSLPMNGLSFHDATKVYFTFKSDNPIFYFCSVMSASSGDNFVMLCDPDYCDPDLRDEVQGKIMDYLYYTEANLPDSDKVYDKVKDIHDKLCEEMDYARDRFGRPSDEYWAHDVTGAIMYGNGVCESYSRTFQLMLNYIDIDNRMVTGVASGDNHSWNAVRMEDGLNYFVDCTWDDQQGGYEYFLKGSDYMDRDHRLDEAGDDPTHFLPDVEDISTDDYDPDKERDDETSSDEDDGNEQDDHGDDRPDDKDTTDKETTSSEDKQENTKGDANGDGEINVTDIAVIASHIKGIKPLDEKGAKAADVNGDNEINVTDIAMIAGHIKGIKALT